MIRGEPINFWGEAECVWFVADTIFLSLSRARKLFSRDVGIPRLIERAWNFFPQWSESCEQSFVLVAQVCLQEVFSKSSTLPQKSNGPPLSNAYSYDARSMTDRLPNQTSCICPRIGLFHFISPPHDYCRLRNYFALFDLFKKNLLLFHLFMFELPGLVQLLTSKEWSS